LLNKRKLLTFILIGATWQKVIFGKFESQRGMLRLIGHNIPSNQTHHPVKQTIQPIKNDFYYCRAMLRGGSTLLSGRGLTDGMRSILLDPLAFS
jgi:hypothetical protein